MRVQSVVRWLLPNEDHFFEYLERQAAIAHDASKVLLDLKNGASVADVRGSMQKLEHDGDKVFRGLLDALAQTFVTPIDREDLQHLSAELDDVLDSMNGAVRAASLYGVEQMTPPMSELADLLVSATEILAKAMPLLRMHEHAKLTQSMVAIRRLEKDADAIVRSAVSQLFSDAGVDAKQLLREREVLDDLGTAIDHCDRVAATLTNVAVKIG